MTKSLMKRLVEVWTIGAIPVLTICVFVPLTLYAGNSSEFEVSYHDVLLTLLPYAIIVIAAIGLLGIFFSDVAYQRFLNIIAALGVLVWLQGNLLVWDYGVLDGQDINWLAGAWRGVLDLGIWCIVILVACSANVRLTSKITIVAAATIAIQCVVAATTLVSDRSNLSARSGFVPIELAADAMTRFSGQKNVVHIVMDGFQSDIFEQIIDDPTNADIRKQLQGFTLFPDNLGAYPYTQMTVPAMLSGRLYRNNVPVADFLDNVFSGDTILNAAFDAGFEVDIAAPIALKNVYSHARHSNAYGIIGRDNATEEDYIRHDAAKLIDLSLFRVVPHFAKPLIYRDQRWIFQSSMRSAAYFHRQYFSDLRFLQRLTDRMTADRDKPVYKLIHVMLSHRPTVGDERCEYSGHRHTNRVNVTVHARCGLMRVVDVLQRMRDLGIYEQSLIVLMGDHGAWVPVDSLMNEEVNPAGVNKMWVAIATPMLAIKPPGVMGNIRVSAAPTSVVDVSVTIANMLGLDGEFGGTPVFSIRQDAPRERRHLIYKYGSNPHAEGYLFPMLEYRVDGSPLDASAWHLEAQHNPTMVRQARSDAP
jgi:hypothetical protein